jgi:hypothetical protein
VAPVSDPPARPARPPPPTPATGGMLDEGSGCEWRFKADEYHLYMVDFPFSILFLNDD